MNLRIRRPVQTQEKTEKEGLLDEDDYGRAVPPENLWNIIPNHPDGSFYGLDTWTDNFCSLMNIHPAYIDADGAFAGRWVYFMSKMRPNKWDPDYPHDFLKENIKKYDLIYGTGDDAHFALDYEIGVKLGWNGLTKKIEHYQSMHHSEEQQHFYSLHLRVIRSVQGWIQRYTDRAHRMAASAADDCSKNNLLEIARVNENIINDALTTLREACQWIIWYYLASRTYNHDGADGQIDTSLAPFYEKGLVEGRIDKEAVAYYLACFLLNDPVYWQLGGPDESGKGQTFLLSFLILEAADKTDTSSNLTVRVLDGLNKDLFRKLVEYLVKNKNGWSRLSGDKTLVEGSIKNGFSTQLARHRIAMGRNWMLLSELEYIMNDLVKINMVEVLEASYTEMMNEQKDHSTSRLWMLSNEHLAKAAQTSAGGIRHHLKLQKYNEPELLLNLLNRGPLEKGKDVSDGGAEYYNLVIDGTGLATVADSFAVLKQCTELENKLSWNTLIEYLRNNFSGDGGCRIRHLLKNSEKYGATESLGEK